MIPNHYAAALSELDRSIARAVPPGGNWKNVPDSVPSKRLRQIRESYAAGKGSRSTYYGRLRPDAPSYTISTYFVRPGNGCHLHYEGDQHRTLSQREAARLQSFPDSFAFAGSRTAVNKQIGNAVPPLLAYQVALAFPTRGLFADLFSGAGGLSLGFTWAGWRPVVANDIEPNSMNTYRANIHDVGVVGDLREPAVFDAVLRRCREAREEEPDAPFYVLGGPPCQGFSTAGNRRSWDDDRNWLFLKYRAMIEALQPDGFVFENVPGILNMEGGRAFEAVRDELQATAEQLTLWTLRAEDFGIPQRRTRVFLVGHRSTGLSLPTPAPLTRMRREGTLLEDLPSAVSVRDALSDLPPLEPGEDGSHKVYLSVPQSSYQALMRSELPPSVYLKMLKDRALLRPA